MKKQYIDPLRRQLGMTLIELIAALGVAAVVIVGALSLYQSADASQKSNELLSGITSVRGAIRQLFGGNYSGELLLAVANSNKLPSSWIPTGSAGAYTAVNNVFGTVTVTATTATTMTMVLNRIPSSVCSSVATAVQGWDSISIGTTVVATYPLDAGETRTIAEKCASTTGFVNLSLTGT